MTPIPDRFAVIPLSSHQGRLAHRLVNLSRPGSTIAELDPTVNHTLTQPDPTPESTKALNAFVCRALGISE